MAQDIKLGAGQVGSAAREVLAENSRAVWTFLAIFVPLSVVATLLDGSTSEDNWGVNLDAAEEPFESLFMLLNITGQYWLFERILLGGPMEGRRRALAVLGFFGLALISWVGTGLAMLLLIIPGLFVGGRWLMSPSFYTARGLGVFAALGESWNRTRGNTFPIALNLLVVVLLVGVAGTVLGGLTVGIDQIAGATASQAFAALFDAILGELFTVLLIAMSVGTYRLLAADGEALADVFA